MAAQMFVEHVDEVSGAVGAGHLAIAEEVADGEQLFLHDFDAIAAVGLAAVVAVTEMEEIDVPLIRGIMLVKELFAGLEGAADLSPAILAQMIERVLVHFLCVYIVHNVA